MNLLIFRLKHWWRDIDVNLSTLLPGSHIFDQPFTTSDQWIRMTVLTVELVPGRLSKVQKDANHAVMPARLRYQLQNVISMTSYQVTIWYLRLNLGIRARCRGHNNVGSSMRTSLLTISAIQNGYTAWVYCPHSLICSAALLLLHLLHCFSVKHILFSTAFGRQWKSWITLL